MTFHTRFTTPTNTGRRAILSRRGFSAVELIAVATIMAILAMLLVQSLRPRVEEARQTAAKHEMNELRDVMETAFAETNHYFLLQHYDNTTNYTDTSDPLTTPLEVPTSYFNYAGTVEFFDSDSAQRRALANQWNGPYQSTSDYFTRDEVYDYLPEIFSDRNGGGPFYREGNDDEEIDRYPKDPWDNPYIFESTYRGPVLYSMGPDGLPGPDPNKTQPANFPQNEHFFSDLLDTNGHLGAVGSDDLVLEF